MPLTRTQATTKNLVNSLKDYIASNIVTPYNTEAAASPYPTAASIGLAYPDDPDIFASVPRIIIELPLSDVGQVTGTGCGDGIVWRTKQVQMTVYPGLTSDNKPSVQSMEALMTLFDYALGSGLYIPIKDYSLSSLPLIDTMEIVSPRLMTPKGRRDPTLALERHRFDYTLNLRYSQVAING